MSVRRVSDGEQRRSGRRIGRRYGKALVVSAVPRRQQHIDRAGEPGRQAGSFAQEANVDEDRRENRDAGAEKERDVPMLSGPTHSLVAVVTSTFHCIHRLLRACGHLGGGG